MLADIMRYWPVLLFGLMACVESSPSRPPAAAPAPASETGTEAASRPSSAGSRPASTERPAPGPGVVYIDGQCGADAPCPCRGVLRYGQNALARIGITEKQLAAGTPCLIADFDGNQVDDLAFVDTNFGDPTQAAQVQVLLFDQYGLTAAVALPKRVRTLGVRTLADGRAALVEPGPTEKKFRFVFEGKQFRFETVEPE